jgi:hypothetical protein
MMQKPDARSVMGVMMGVLKIGSAPSAPASRNTPRGGFNISVKRANAPDRVRTMAVPVASATSQPRYLAAQEAA